MLRTIFPVLAVLLTVAFLTLQDRVASTTKPATLAEERPSAPVPPRELGPSGPEVNERVAAANVLAQHWSDFVARKRKDAPSFHVLVNVRDGLRAVPEGNRKADEARAAIARLDEIAPAVEKAFAPEAARRAKQEAIEEQQRKASLRKLVDEMAPAVRKRFAESIETDFLKAGMDVSVYAEGEATTTLRLKYVLMSRPLVYKLANDTKLIEGAKAAGFRSIIFADGYRSRWVYSVTNAKFD
jgi:hypothetical protein